jgi:hypothetical protein
MEYEEKRKFLLIVGLPALLILVVILYSFLGWETGTLEVVVGAIVSMVLGYFGIAKGSSIIQQGLSILERRKVQTRDDKEPSEQNRKLNEESI